MNDEKQIYHIPVLLHESIQGMNLHPGGIYVDVTFGGGGHSKEILKNMGEGSRLFGFDQDADAEKNIIDDPRFTFVRSNFRYLHNFLRYYGVEKVDGMDYIANGDIAKLVSISRYEDRYGLHFATARIAFPDYDDQEIVAKVILDTLESESASLTYEQQNMLYAGVNEDYSHIASKKKRYEAVREDLYFNALQLKYANAVTGHKSQGGQWKCVFIDNPFWQEELSEDDLKWLYTAITRAVEKVYFVNFNDRYF